MCDVKPCTYLAEKCIISPSCDMEQHQHHICKCCVRVRSTTSTNLPFMIHAQHLFTCGFNFSSFHLLLLHSNSLPLSPSLGSRQQNNNTRNNIVNVNCNSHIILNTRKQTCSVLSFRLCAIVVVHGERERDGDGDEIVILLPLFVWQTYGLRCWFQPTYGLNLKLVSLVVCVCVRFVAVAIFRLNSNS